MSKVSCRDRNKNAVYADGSPKKPNWEYRFYDAPVNGKPSPFSKTGFATEDEAMRAGIKAMEEYTHSGSVFRESRMSYADCLQSWLDNYVAIRCTDTTKAGYEKRILNYIQSALGKYRLTALKHDSVQTFINSMFDRHFSRNTLSSLLGIITSSLRYAKRQGWVRENPADDIDLPSIRQSRTLRHKERNAISRENMAKIFQRFPEGTTTHLPMMLAYHCGLRLGEAFGLTWNDVDLNQGFLTVNQQIQHFVEAGRWRLVPPKYDSVRQIRLDNEIWALLKREHRRQMEQRMHYGHNYVQPYIDEQNYLNYDGRGDMIWMVNTYEDGRFVQPNVTHHSNRMVHLELGIADFDFHSLRHPYVKPTTKKLFLPARCRPLGFTALFCFFSVFSRKEIV